MNLYELLQVDRNASKEVILMAYKALAKKYHPDINPELLDMMKQINYAKEILMNDELRADYNYNLDNEINNNYTKSETESSNTYGTQEEQRTEINTVKPWKRFIAKIIDLFALGYITGYSFANSIPGGLAFLNQFELEFFSNIMLTLIIILLEAMLVSMFGTTPGKFIFSIQILNENHQKLSIVKSIMRSLSAVVFGYGFGIPIISLLVMFHNYDLIKNKGSTNYDNSCGAIVITKKRNLIQLIMVGIITFFVGSGLVTVYLNESSADVNQYEPYVAEQTNLLLDEIEKEMLEEEAEIENEREYLIEWGDELYILLEEVLELEKQLEDFPEDGDENEYNQLFEYYILKWDEYDLSYSEYNERIEKLNKTIDDFNVKYRLTN